MILFYLINFSSLKQLDCLVLCSGYPKSMAWTNIWCIHNWWLDNICWSCWIEWSWNLNWQCSWRFCWNWSSKNHSKNETTGPSQPHWGYLAIWSCNLLFNWSIWVLQCYLSPLLGIEQSLCPKSWHSKQILIHGALKTYPEWWMLERGWWMDSGWVQSLASFARGYFHPTPFGMGSIPKACHWWVAWLLLPAMYW